MKPKTRVEIVRLDGKNPTYHNQIGVLQGKTITLECGTRIYASKHKFKRLFNLHINDRIDIKPKLGRPATKQMKNWIPR